MRHRIVSNRPVVPALWRQNKPHYLLTRLPVSQLVALPGCHLYSWAEVVWLMQEVRRKQGVSGMIQGGLARERRITSYGDETLSSYGQSGEMDCQTFDVS